MRMKRTGKIVITLVTVLLLVLTVACAPAPQEITPAPTPAPAPEEVTPPAPIAPAGMGILEVHVTDPPEPEFDSILVSVDNITVHKVVPGQPGEWIDVPLTVSSFDLVTLVGVEEFLGSVQVEAGKFTQIRVYIDTVMVTPEGGTSQSATVPSNILRIVRPFEVQEGLITALTLDFDGARSVVTTGQGNFIFKPVVKLLIEEKGEEEKERERESEQEAEGLEFEGTIEAINGDNWTMTIEGETWIVDVSEAEIEGEPAVGLQAEVEGNIVDETIVASEVEIKEAEE